MGSSTDAGDPADPDNRPAAKPPGSAQSRTEIQMILATTTVDDIDQFLAVFGEKGADKRAFHGSKGSAVFRDPSDESRVWAIFDWDEQGWTSFVTDPEVPPILKDAGHRAKPVSAVLLGSYRA
jgi:hypothetical protein